MHRFLRLAAVAAFGAVASALPAISTDGWAQGAPGGAAPPPPPVTVARPVVKEVVEYDDFTGRFEAVDFVEVRARVTGYIERVAFQDGTMVKKGDLLFEIDRRPYKATLDQAEAALFSAQARFNFAENDLERAESLRKTGNISDQLLDQRRQNSISARGDLDRAQATVREARLNDEFTEVRAPIDGRISRRLISEGNLVTANQTLLTTIVSLDPLYFNFDVDERAFLAYSRTGQLGIGADGRARSLDVKVGVTDEREPKRPGRLDFLDNRLDQATGTIRARARVPNADLFITPGLFGTIRVPGSAPYRGVLVPDEAVATDQDRRLVWVVAPDNSVSARVVRPGPRIDGYRLIREGLTGEETVVIAGIQRVRPGARVTPQMTQLPPSR
jgi:multidrug efflux system membrane fusion protein